METVNEIKVVETKKSNKYENKEAREMHYKDSKYFNDYYQKTNIKVICPNCEKETPKRNISSHKKGIKCQFLTLKKQIEEQLII